MNRNLGDFPVAFLLELKKYVSDVDRMIMRRVNNRWYSVFSFPDLYANVEVRDDYIFSIQLFYYGQRSDGTRQKMRVRKRTLPL